ncbi:hypothetical protein AU210_016398 [Fusarium oxysporum f. sp. radicis-cucumerinum]|uniref:Uncharacterized protein n=1 Tax=Fusarium oxysporum f. sp. radicis-cucumerinum TaxID=327505 RepID=A0A2H3FP80_FUSOX|nr:hypothetical protein AU210_016398 [Fusarium oxysporum f. sp. radicis-cucumerinum]
MLYRPLYLYQSPSTRMEDQRCSLPSISNLLDLADAGSPLNKSSPTSRQHCPPFEVAHSSCSHGRDGSEWAKLSRRGLPPTPPMSTDASFEAPAKPSSQSGSGSAPRPFCCETTARFEAGAHSQASITAIPRATPPVLAPRPQRHHAEHANPAAQMSPTVQAPEMNPYSQRPPQPASTICHVHSIQERINTPVRRATKPSADLAVSRFIAAPILERSPSSAPMMGAVWLLVYAAI